MDIGTVIKEDNMNTVIVILKDDDNMDDGIVILKMITI
jgi:hypothetical protein